MYDDCATFDTPTDDTVDTVCNEAVGNGIVVWTDDCCVDVDDDVPLPLFALLPLCVDGFVVDNESPA